MKQRWIFLMIKGTIHKEDRHHTPLDTFINTVLIEFQERLKQKTVGKQKFQKPIINTRRDF